MSNKEHCCSTKSCMMKSKSCSSSGLSDYSTCSDNLIGYKSQNKDNAQISRSSVILAGKISLNDYRELSSNTLEDSVLFNIPNADITDETNYSVNLLDQNLDVLIEDDDVFTDCLNSSKCDSIVDDSTKYLQIEVSKMKSNNIICTTNATMNKLDKNNEEVNSRQSNLGVVQKPITDNERLLTILEETETTHIANSIVKNPTSTFDINRTGDLIVEMVDKLKSCANVNCNKNPIKKVLFVNEDNVINYKETENKRIDKPKLKKRDKTPNPLVGKNKSSMGKKSDIDENCNNHNTTESFIMWEKFCESSEPLRSRRSFSYSELNSITESYGGDDEYSTTFKTLDDTYISNCSFDTLNNTQKKNCRYKSKSCDSLLREVKHLPHMMYDRFLKCLAEEIENMRKQNVICTCQKPDKRCSNKENKAKTSKPIANKPLIILQNEINYKKQTKLSLEVSPLKTVTNQTRLSPEIIKDSTQNIRRLTPKSPCKTPTTPSKKQGHYLWQKEIISPVGEYIRGKRKSPLKNSPSKKKI